MKRLKLAKRFTSRLKGVPKSALTHLDRPGTVAVLPSHIPHIKPKLLVKKGDTVSIGTPLFQDKRHPEMVYLSPGSGEVIQIEYGWRRAIDEIVIRLDGAKKEMASSLLQAIAKAYKMGGKFGSKEGDRSKKEDGVKLTAPNNGGPVPGNELWAGGDDRFCLDFEPEVAATSNDIMDALVALGMWQMIRQFPYMDVASPAPPFPMGIVSLESGELFSPRADVVLKDRWHDFKWGLAVMEKLTHEMIVSAPAGRMESLAPIAQKITHITEENYPAGDPGVILYQVKRTAAQNRSVTIHLQDLLAIGALFGRGFYDLHRIFTVGGEGIYRPCHLRSRLGSPIFHLIGAASDSGSHVMGQLHGQGVVVGGLFTGRRVWPGNANLGDETELSHSGEDGVTNKEGAEDGSGSWMGHGSTMGHLGGDEYIVTALDCSVTDQLFGFVVPGANAMSESATFLSGLGREPVPGDLNLHGEERACINCGLCDKKCPVDLLPQFIMKTAKAGEMEEVIEMGLLDCTLCGLCSVVCPSKIDLARLFSVTKELYYKDRIEILR